MSNTTKLSKLRFGSLLSYSPHGSSESERRAKDVMLFIKADKFYGKPPVLMSRFISNFIRKTMGTLPFAHFFKSNPILVPIPNSSLVKENTLRVPHRIADAMHENGLGMGVGDMLERRIPLPKAAKSRPAERPTATQHYRSLEVHEIFDSTKRNSLDR